MDVEKKNNSLCIEVDQDTFEKMKNMFGIYDGDSGHGRIGTSKDGTTFFGYDKDFVMRFMIHQGPLYFLNSLSTNRYVNKYSLKYCIYINTYDYQRHPETLSNKFQLFN